MRQRRRARALPVMAILAISTCLQAGQVQPAQSTIRTVVVAPGLELHYRNVGKGAPVVFVHGSLSDLTYWDDQLPAFAAAGYRAIAYSRRYNWPNTNNPQPRYSAVTDADDLAKFIARLGLNRVDVVGHSYGAYTALLLALRHPELVNKLVLCEAPAVPLLNYLPEAMAAEGKRTFADIQQHMVKPMQESFRRGDREAGVRTFIDYVMRDPHAWDKLPAAARQDALKNAREWDVMMTIGDLFPEVRPAAVKRIKAPVLLMSGDGTYPFLTLIDEELGRLLPNNKRLVLHGATHRMWYEQPEKCRKAVLGFFAQAGAGR